MGPTGTTEYELSTHNRRREKRLSCHGNLSVVVKNSNKGVLGLFPKSSTATWMDFNHVGIAFQTNQQFDPGERLLLDLSITDTSQVALSNVAAVVRHATVLSDKMLKISSSPSRISDIIG
jgi:hypothetical protein